ncbi:MAG: hypothetical protein GWM90_24720 [Gemmatimonadetes bacterium]|nr:hypothetical protein [Gemmatimonadota bacterium]NIQ57983.1 hypothetical protein [Gemmatimonadota bacterium]NIU78164.1 hypothetical protein [Gammaproteobacteria bacterium]NIX47160.1 hypothetical protein [Gemmatimonadota bacterium]NIY11541.1 hypothetical protein [Gemmatimonadota bacterium]
MSSETKRTEPAGPGRERTLERRLLGWLLALTVAPSLVLLAVGGWALATSLGLAGALGPWEEVAASGRRVVELAEPTGDSALVAALDSHRQALSQSLTQARRWAFLGERFVAVLPWGVLAVAVVLVTLAYAATRQLARQLARPIEELVVLADRLGRSEPLPEPPRRSVHEVRLLDTALREAAGELEAARERAVAAERVRVWGEMARRVAHEMKNPLTPLRFAAHRLQRAGASPGPEAGGDAALTEAVEVIDEEVGRLEELAAQFGQLGRPPEGPPSEVDVRELLASLLETDAAGRARTTLDAPAELPPVRGHYDALFRAFRNLVRNALEAVEAVGDPWVGVALELEEGDGAGRWLVARVMDNGGGLPARSADRIFEPDFTTKTRGTGLGLALVRQAVTADGGTVAARDRNGGAELVVRLPVAESGIHPTTPESGDE